MINKVPKQIFIIFAIGLFLYFISLFNSFVWDDEELILNNVQVHSLTNLPAFLSGSTFNSGGAGNLSGLYYKPMMTISFSFLYTLFGPNPFFFHLFQVLIHLANACLLFLILNFILKKDRPAFFLALIFLLHPINVEPVVYVADLQDVLFFFFGMGAFYLLLTRNHQKTPWYGAGLLLLSLLSKETGVVILLSILLYLFLFNRETLKKFIFPVISCLAVYFFLRFGVAHIFFNKHGLTSITTMPLFDRLTNIPAIIFFYLKTFFWPENLAINQQWVIKVINWQTFGFPLMVSSLFFGTLIFFTRSKISFFFLSFFLLALGLHLQIFPLDLTVSDRWFYLPMAGLLGFAGTIHFLKIKYLKYLVYFVLLLLFLRSFVRTLDWRDGLTLYSHDVTISKDAFDLENNLGVELFRIGQYQQAKIHFEKSVILSPQWWTNWNNLGAVIEREGDLQKAKDYYQKSIDNGHYYLAYENMAKLLLRIDPPAAKKFATASLQYFPYNQALVDVYRQSFTTATVTRVVDGDTLVVNLAGQDETIRVIGINSPELENRQCQASAAAQLAKNILTNQTVTINSEPAYEDQDQYHRLLRYITLSDKSDFGSIMITAGLAKQYDFGGKKYKFRDQYKSLEQKAKESKLGLWSSFCAKIL